MYWKKLGYPGGRVIVSVAYAKRLFMNLSIRRKLTAVLGLALFIGMYDKYFQGVAEEELEVAENVRD